MTADRRGAVVSADELQAILDAAYAAAAARRARRSTRLERRGKTP